MISKILVVLSAVVLFSSDVNAFGKELRSTWRLNMSEPYAFDLLPKTRREADQQGWNLITENNDCTNGNKFYGYRYAFGDDLGFFLLFDRMGYIAGVQTNLIKSDVALTPHNYNYDLVPAFVPNNVRGKDMYSLTAYFVNPKIICTIGRNFLSVMMQGVGTDLYFQNGPGTDPSKGKSLSDSNFYKVPKSRDEAVAKGWGRNLCIPAMGFHSAHGTADLEATDCQSLYPFVPNYDAEHGQLYSFAWTILANCVSPRFEHPNSLGVRFVLGDTAPQCLLEAPTKSGFCELHIFLYEKPWEFKCPAGTSYVPHGLN